MAWSVLVGLFVAVHVVAAALTGLVVRLLRRRAILDHPNDRSSHAIPTPRGGGIAAVAVIACGCLAMGLFLVDGALGTEMIALAGGLAVLAIVSGWDDVRGLPVAIRLAAQAAVVFSVSLFAWPFGGPFAEILPPTIGIALTALLWLWFVNLFNFMDGIDGLASAEAACIGLGVAVCAVLAGADNRLPIVGVVAAGAALGFLWWNWRPARVFLGDVGSIPLGFVLGWLLLRLAADGAWVAALLLPLYFLIDATLTLGLRAVRGEKVWRAHRSHFYQRATAAGRRHDSVVIAVVLVNATLIGLAALSVDTATRFALPAGIAVVAVLLVYWARSAR